MGKGSIGFHPIELVESHSSSIPEKTLQRLEITLLGRHVECGPSVGSGQLERLSAIVAGRQLQRRLARALRVYFLHRDRAIDKFWVLACTSILTD